MKIGRLCQSASSRVKLHIKIKFYYLPLGIFKVLRDNVILLIVTAIKYQTTV